MRTSSWKVLTLKERRDNDYSFLVFSCQKLRYDGALVVYTHTLQGAKEEITQKVYQDYWWFGGDSPVRPWLLRYRFPDSGEELETEEETDRGEVPETHVPVVRSISVSPKESRRNGLLCPQEKVWGEPEGPYILEPGKRDQGESGDLQPEPVDRKN